MEAAMTPPLPPTIKPCPICRGEGTVKTKKGKWVLCPVCKGKQVIHTTFEPFKEESK